MYSACSHVLTTVIDYQVVARRKRSEWKWRCKHNLYAACNLSLVRPVDNDPIVIKHALYSRVGKLA